MPPRKKQRGASGAATAASSAAAAASSSASSIETTLLTRRYSLRLNPPQPHQRLHRHALESIFGFLSFDELRSAMFVSQNWLAAVGSMRGLECGKKLVRAELVAAALKSRLARHVTCIGDRYHSLPFTRAQVQQIASRMSFLRQLSFHPQGDEEWSAEERLSLPATLSEVSIGFDAAASATSVNAILAALSPHEPLAKLALFFSGTLPEQVSFAPLQSLPALKSLRLQNGSYDDATLSDAQVQQLRSLTQLHPLDCHFREQTLLQILQPPHQLRWTELPYYSRYCITDALAALIPSLSHLRSFCLGIRLPSLSSLDFLAQLPSLTAVEVEGSDADELLLTLSVALPRVVDLRLKYSALNTEQLTALLTHFPQLCKLTLRGVDRFDSLTFLEPVRSTLRSLSLGSYFGFDFTADGVQILRTFDLTHLAIDRQYGTAIAASLVQALTPPSTLIPTLQHFEYTPPVQRR